MANACYPGYCPVQYIGNEIVLYNFWHKYCQIDLSASELCFPIDFSDHVMLGREGVGLRSCYKINYAYIYMLIGQQSFERLLSGVTSHGLIWVNKNYKLKEVYP